MEIAKYEFKIAKSFKTMVIVSNAWRNINCSKANAQNFVPKIL